MTPAILNVPETSADWSNWSFQYQRDIIDIQTALRADGVHINNYQLDPIPFDDIDNWLSRVQQTHNDFNSALGLQGSDLSAVDLADRNERQAWIWLVYLEVVTARKALAI